MLKHHKKCPYCTMTKKCLWHRKSFLGFNLIQIIVTVAVLAIIAGTVMYNEDPEKRIGKAHDAQRVQELNAITKAIESYEVDNHAIPGDFSMATLGIGEKVVLCSAAATLSCDGQSNDCLVVDDPNFLGKYLPVLPVDPDKSSEADTGYYVTRSENNTGLVVGACDTYDTSKELKIGVKATLPDYEPPPQPVGCGNGVLDTGELCDYSAAGTTCVYQPDYYTQGIVYDSDYCVSPVGCSSSCNSCLTSCSSSGGGSKTLPCAAPCEPLE